MQKLKSIYCTCSLVKFLFPTLSYPDSQSTPWRVEWSEGVQRRTGTGTSQFSCCLILSIHYAYFIGCLSNGQVFEVLNRLSIPQSVSNIPVIPTLLLWIPPSYDDQPLFRSAVYLTYPIWKCFLGCRRRDSNNGLMCSSSSSAASSTFSCYALLLFNV